MLRNLGDAVHALADRHGSAIRRAAQAVADEGAATDAAGSAPPAAPGPPDAAARVRAASLSRRQARYEEAARLHGQGVPISRIAALLGAERKTMRGWLRRGGAPSWRKPKRGSILHLFMPELERRWAERCRNAMQLWHEVAAAGFAGQYDNVHAWATQRRGGRTHRKPTHIGCTAPRPACRAPADG